MVDKVKLLKIQLDNLQKLNNSLSRFKGINLENPSYGFVNLNDIFDCTESKTPRFDDQVEDLIKQIGTYGEITYEQFGNLLTYTVFVENDMYAVRIVKAVAQVCVKNNHMFLTRVPEWLGWSHLYKETIIDYNKMNNTPLIKNK